MKSLRIETSVRMSRSRCGFGWAAAEEVGEAANKSASLTWTAAERVIRRRSLEHIQMG